MNDTANNGGCCGPVAVKDHATELATFEPAVDIVRGETEARIYADLPGVEQDALEVHFERGVLALRGRASPRAADRKPLREEFAPRNFARSFRLSDEFDGSKATAEYVDGVLCLRVPLAASARARKIDVRAGRG